MANNGNAALRAARQALGYRSQAALADALTDAARAIGLRIEVAARTVRRWESTDPPWPHPEHAAALEALFKRPITELGFAPPWPNGSEGRGSREALGTNVIQKPGRYRRTMGGAELPAAVAKNYVAITVAHRGMYWSLPAKQLHRSVSYHARMGSDLIPQIDVRATVPLARAVAESALLAGRLEFFDLQQPDEAQTSFVLALQAAHEAADALLGCAVLAHMAFVPAFSGEAKRAEEARERVRAARAFARRGNGNHELTAWLDAVEAEVETRFGNTRQALSLIRHAEQSYALHDPQEQPSPQWLDWFSPTRLAGFKANTLISAGDGREALATLRQVLDDLPAESVKQRSVYLADAAAACVLQKLPEQACGFLEDALDGIGEHWYATTLDRIKVVRQDLRKWDSLPEVRALDERLYDWHTTVNSLSG
ncbi:helix-turn-helix transcriptional regulator [Nocardia sp. FBN12]|uniref:helix-turn-helix transcriptional regulator n=1 Tax=Nocardia sp. FBN12 TaxID=3419766 RepID=UPI003D04B154